MRNRSGRRVLLSIALVVAVAGTSGCGSRRDQQAIVDALAPLAHQPAAATSLPVAQQQPSALASAAVPAGIGTPLAATGPATRRTTKIAVAAKPSAGVQKAVPTAPAALASRPAYRSTLTFGTVGTYSGFFGILTPIAKALTAWVAMQNDRGGLDGHPIKLIVGDDGGDPSTGLTLAKRMVEKDHIVSFVGSVEIFGMDQYADYAKSQGLPWIGGDGIDPRWFNDPNVFPALSPLSTSLISGMQDFVNHGHTRLGATYCLEIAKLCAYNNDLLMKSSVGKYVIDDEQVSLVAPSYTSQCLRMQASKIDVIFAFLDTAGIQRFVQDCSTQGYKPLFMTISIAATAQFPKIDILQGMFVPGPTVPPSESQLPAVTEYRAALAKYAHGEDPSGLSEIGWASGRVLGLAGAHLSDNPTVAEFKQNLWTLKGNTLGGFAAPVTFRQDQPAVASTCTFIWGVKDHAFFAPRGAKPVC
jgi:branched-chain amino acid transport system substrate-binding protein